MTDLDTEIPAVLALATKGVITGKVRLQKIFCLLHLADAVGEGYDFVLYHHGPYSKNLEYAISRLARKKQVNVEKKHGEWGGYYFEYRLPQENNRQIKELNNLREKIVKLCSSSNLSSSILELSVTALFLKAEDKNIKNVWNKVAELKSQKDFLIPKAKEFCERLYEIDKENVLPKVL